MSSLKSQQKLQEQLKNRQQVAESRIKSEQGKAFDESREKGMLFFPASMMPGETRCVLSPEANDYLRKFEELRLLHERHQNSISLGEDDATRRSRLQHIITLADEMTSASIVEIFKLLKTPKVSLSDGKYYIQSDSGPHALYGVYRIRASAYFNMAASYTVYKSAECCELVKASVSDVTSAIDLLNKSANPTSADTVTEYAADDDPIKMRLLNLRGKGLRVLGLFEPAFIDLRAALAISMRLEQPEHNTHVKDLIGLIRDWKRDQPRPHFANEEIQSMCKEIGWLMYSPEALRCFNTSCRVRPGPSVKLDYCSRCMQARYCSTECQRADWIAGKHKHACAPFQNFDEPRTVTLVMLNKNIKHMIKTINEVGSISVQLPLTFKGGPSPPLIVMHDSIKHTLYSSITNDDLIVKSMKDDAEMTSFIETHRAQPSKLNLIVAIIL
jgi:hypothetical protein